MAIHKSSVICRVFLLKLYFKLIMVFVTDAAINYKLCCFLSVSIKHALNIKLYPVFQKYFRDYKPPILAVWGNKDPYFSPAGAEGFKKDDPNTTVKFYNTGHFALETNGDDIGRDILDFMEKLKK